MSSKVRPTSTFEAFRSELERNWRRTAGATVLESVDSTNAAARREIESRAAGSWPRVLVAFGQTAGRGRRGRSWASAPGSGVFATVATPPLEPAAVAELPLLSPVTVCAALEAIGVADCRLKWPNDLLVRGRKLGGLLIETVAAGRRPRAAIVGLGVNYLMPEEPALARTAIGLEELLDPLPSLASVVRSLVEPLADLFDGSARRRPTDLVPAYRALSAHRFGEPLACRTASETVVGDFAGFDDRGFLRLAVGDGERLISSGEVIEGASGRA